MVKTSTQTAMLSGVLWVTATDVDVTEIVAIGVMFLLLLGFNVADEARFFGLLDIGRRAMYAGLGFALALMAMAILLGPAEAVSWVEHAIARVEASR